MTTNRLCIDYNTNLYTRKRTSVLVNARRMKLLGSVRHDWISYTSNVYLLNFRTIPRLRYVLSHLYALWYFVYLLNLGEKSVYISSFNLFPQNSSTFLALLVVTMVVYPRFLQVYILL